MPDAARPLQRLVPDLLTSQPGGYFIGAASFGIPAAYIASESDNAMPRPHAQFAARLGVQPRRRSGDAQRNADPS